jgi:hypothetical protein
VGAHGKVEGEAMGSSTEEKEMAVAGQARGEEEQSHGGEGRLMVLACEADADLVSGW